MSKKTTKKTTKRRTNRKKQRNMKLVLAVVSIAAAALFASVSMTACDEKTDSKRGDDSSHSEKENSKYVSSDENSKDIVVSEDVSDNSSSDSSQAGNIVDGDVSADDVGNRYSEIPWYKSENKNRYIKYGEANGQFSAEQVVTYVNIGLDSAYYTNTHLADYDAGQFILVNKYSYVDEKYVPANLVELDPSCKVSGKSVKLSKVAADAFKKLSDDAAKLEYCILGMSGYRTYEYQKNLYNNYLKNDPQSVVDTYSARPGYSEHHTGYALDVQTDTVSFSNFGSTKEYEWLLDNAHKYGFVIHYTEDNKWITGYDAEAWHIRYLGVEAATYIYEHNLSVDEYLVMFGSDGPSAAG